MTGTAQPGDRIPPHPRPTAGWTRHAAVAMAAALILAGPGRGEQPADRVRLVTGVELEGTVVDQSPNGLAIETRDGIRKVSVETIRDVRFAGEPEGLRDARELLARRDGTAALEELSRIEPDELSGGPDAIAAEVAFVRAAAAGRRAVSTGDDVAAGQREVAAFLSAHPRSVHLYDMQVLLGDLLAAQGRTDEAAAAYATLDRGPPAIAVRAATLRADLLLRRSAVEDALRLYESASRLAAAIEGPMGRRAGRRAELGRARCLTRQGKAGDAEAVVERLLAEADGDDHALGLAFTVLGEAQRRLPGRERDALISFLTVDLVHPDGPEEHAEALFNLVELWQQTNFPERSREARRSLETTYPDSPWTRRLPPDGSS